MEIEYTRKATISVDEFGWETYPLPEEWDYRSLKYSTKDSDRIPFNQDLAVDLLRKWGYGEGDMECEIEKFRQLDNQFSAYHTESLIFGIAYSEFREMVHNTLLQTSEHICGMFPHIGRLVSESGRVNYYRDKNTKGILKLDNELSHDAPTLSLEATEEIDLEKIMRRIRNYVSNNWDLPKPKV